MNMPYIDRGKQKQAAKRHYEANKEVYKRRAKEHRKRARRRNMEYVVSVRKSNHCADCRENNWIVLEFDHVRGEKRDSVMNMVNRPCSLNNIKKEIEKCELVCANCHRVRTYNRRNG